MDTRGRRLVVDGVAAGVIGYVLVIAFFLVTNYLAGRPLLHTAAALGEAVFDGLPDPSGTAHAAGPILAFNGLHMAACLLFGFFTAWLAYEMERHPEHWGLAVVLFGGAVVLGGATVLTFLALLETPVAAGSVGASSLLAAAGVGTYLAVSHRSVLAAIQAGRETRLGRVE